MAVTVAAGLRALDESAERARSIRVDLDDEYLRHIAEVEALPANQSGGDKSWIWKTEHAFQEHYRRARRV